MENKQNIDFLNKEAEPELNSDKYNESVKFIKKLTDLFAYEEQFSGEETYKYIKKFMELDPRYCDVIVRRWQDFTGQEATLEDGGRTFARVKEERGG